MARWAPVVSVLVWALVIAPVIAACSPSEIRFDGDREATRIFRVCVEQKGIESDAAVVVAHGQHADVVGAGELPSDLVALCAEQVAVAFPPMSDEERANAAAVADCLAQKGFAVPVRALVVTLDPTAPTVGLNWTELPEGSEGAFGQAALRCAAQLAES